MATKLSPALLELRAVLNEADTLTANGRAVSKADEARLNVLLAKASALRKDSLAVDDFCKRWFRAMVTGGEVPEELRTAVTGITGAQTITWTQGVAGGYFVPTEFYDELIVGMALVDPLLNPAVTTVVAGRNARPLFVPSWDLTTFSAQKVTEASAQGQQSFPSAKNSKLGGFTYRAELAASFEFEEDDFQPVFDQFSTAFSVGFARGIGADLVNGDGTTGPQGVIAGGADSGVTTASATAITDVELENVFYSVNAYNRAQPKCAWLVNDAVHKILAKMKDGAQRPLFPITNGVMWIQGKPVYICPSLPAYNASLGTQAAGSFCVFGDLSKLVVRISQPTMRRNLNAPGAAENGLGLYTGICRADSKVIDPTGGAVPPIVYARLHS